jgi:cbb3-type cytochrome oxidase subunit 3
MTIQSWISAIQALVLIALILFIAADYFVFRHQGARFTAQDGQNLCLRVQALEVKPKSCEYR